MVLAFSTIANAQKTVTAPKIAQEVRSSATFAELVLRTAELEAELDALLYSYTEEFPRVKKTRYELQLLQSDLDRISKMNASEAQKLTQALGKLLLRRAELATDYWVIKNRVSEEHPDTIKAKRKLQIFENAVKKILD